jgi:hypothetical protein
MKFRESLVETLREERRPSRRMALMAFVRRYSRRDVPVTSWRGTGDTSDAMMSLLSRCGLRDGGAVKLTRSSLDASAWRLAFTPGDPLAEEFVNCCRDAGVPDTAGNAPVDLAVRAAYAEGKDLPTAVELVFPPDRQEEPVAAAPDAPSFADGVAKRTAEILAAVADMPNPPATPSSINTEIAAAKSMAKRALNAPNVPAVAPLPVVEAYVRYMMRPADCIPYDGYAGVPPLFSVFPGSYQERLGTPALVRPVMSDDPDIPLRALTSAPMGYLDGSLVVGEDPFAGSPVEGYLTESLSDLAPGETKDARQLLVVGCASVVGSDTDAQTRVNKSLFIANHPVTFWDYVRWLHDCAYRGAARCWLTPHLRVGCPATPGSEAFLCLDNPAYAHLPRHDADTMFRAGNRRAASGLLSFGAAVFALVLADPSLADPPSGKGRAATVVHLPPTAVMVGEPPEASVECEEDADSDSMYLGKADLPIEWFWLTHSTGVAPDGCEEYLDVQWPSTSRLQASSNALRDFRRRAEANPSRTLLPRCSFARSSGMLGQNVGGGVVFDPASAFYSGLIALLRSFAPDMAFREWNGRAPWSWAIHNSNAVLSAVYSGIETDLSPVTVDEGVFPKMDWRPLGELRDLLALADASGERPPEYTAFNKAVARFTHNVEVMSTKGVGMAKMASRSKGTERTKVVVVETNVDAAAFCRRNTSTEIDAFDKKARELFVQTFGYRNENVLCVADLTGRMDDTRCAAPRYRPVMASMVGGPGASTAGAESEADFYRRGIPGGLADDAWWSDRIQFGAMSDMSGRLYFVFRATGDAGQAMSVGWRHSSRLPVSSATLAAKVGADALHGSGVSPYVSGDLTAIEVSSAVLERRFRLYDQKSHMAIAGTSRGEVGAGGRVTPLFMPETTNLAADDIPPKEWFQDSRFTPVARLLG